MKLNLDDPSQAARAAGLTYSNDDQVGIRRLGRGKHVRYRLPSGVALRDASTLKRIASLALPPAWREVWISPSPDSHLQATGRDARGRKQYRYHADFAAVRDRAKYDHLENFAEILPRIRRRIAADLKLPGLPSDKVLAAVVTLLQETLIRIGNEAYARDNKSFGLTTLRNRHVKVRGAELRFTFRGKSGKDWNLSIRDRRAAKVIRSCQELPGQHLFEYRADEGRLHAVTSSDVNDYLRLIGGADVSAKDFRTWAGTVEAVRAFVDLKGDAAYPSRKTVRDVVARVAARLGNTVAVCRKCYIHPAVIDAFIRGKLPAEAKSIRGLSAAEALTLRLLKRHA